MTISKKIVCESLSTESVDHGNHPIIGYPPLYNQACLVHFELYSHKGHPWQEANVKKKSFTLLDCHGRIWHRRMLPHGLEPWTSRLLAERSSQLSYESCWCTSRRLSYGWRQQHITQDDEVMHVGELIFGPGPPLDMARYKYAPIFTSNFAPEKTRISVRMLAEKQADC